MVTLALAKQHLEYEDSDRDALIQQYIDASKAWIEQHIGKMLTVVAVTQTERAFTGSGSFDRHSASGSYIELARGPFVSLTSIAYTDASNAAQVLTGARVQNGRVYAPLAGWPAIAPYSAVTVTYQAGYSTTPADLVSAQLLMIGHLFANRESVVVGSTANEVPMSVAALCSAYVDLLV